MADEQLSDLPEELDTWVQERAEDADMDPEEVLARSVAAYRFLEGESDALAHDGEGDSAVALGMDESELAEMTDRLADLEERVGGVETALDEKIDDVRQRVIQVKREADSKAEVDHHHENLRKRVESARQAAADAHETATGVRDRVDRIDEGFDNFEEILEYLTETTDDLEDKLTRLAHLSIDLRETVGELEGQAAARSVAADLQEKANREGVSKAKCENCNAKVNLGLLATPHCPDCGRTFSDLTPSSGFLGSSTLVVGDRPALESADSGVPDTPDELFEETEANGVSGAVTAGGGDEAADAASEETEATDDATTDPRRSPASAEDSTAPRAEATDGSGETPETGGVGTDEAPADGDATETVDELFEDA